MGSSAVQALGAVDTGSEIIIHGFHVPENLLAAAGIIDQVVHVLSELRTDALEGQNSERLFDLDSNFLDTQQEGSDQDVARDHSPSNGGPQAEWQEGQPEEEEPGRVPGV